MARVLRVAAFTLRGTTVKVKGNHAGAGEISRLCEQLTSHQSFRDGRRWVLPLHSNISADEQRRAFEIPPDGVRKIVVATNIAETSVTIPDVTCVIDSGKLKVMPKSKISLS